MSTTAANVRSLRVEVEETKPTLLSTASWTLYDFANTIFSLNIVTTFFPAFVLTVAGPNSDWQYSVPQSISQLIIALICPLIGGLSDRGGGKRMPWLVSSTLFCIACTLGMGLIGASSLPLVIGLYVLANVGYQIALVFYDALLPSVSTTTNWGKVSGWGVGIGYAGALLGGFLVTNFFKTGKGFEQNGFIPTALLFFVFSLPCFFLVKERRVRLTAADRVEAEIAGTAVLQPGAQRGIVDPLKSDPLAQAERAKEPLLAQAKEQEGLEPNDFGLNWSSLRHSLAQTWRTLKDSRNYPGLTRFLVANFFYTDALNTVIIAMGVYAVQVVGFDSPFTVLAPAIVAAVIGSVIFGFINDGLGSKKTLSISLGLWMIVLVAAIFITEPTIFRFGIAPLAGIALGSTWVGARTMMIELSPPERLGEFMGIYNITGKFAAVLGPLLWGGTLAIAAVFGLGRLGYQIAIATLLLLIVVGFVIHQGTPNTRRGKRVAGYR